MATQPVQQNIAEEIRMLLREQRTMLEECVNQGKKLAKNVKALEQRIDDLNKLEESDEEEEEEEESEESGSDSEEEVEEKLDPKQFIVLGEQVDDGENILNSRKKFAKYRVPVSADDDGLSHREFKVSEGIPFKEILKRVNRFMNAKVTETGTEFWLKSVQKQFHKRLQDEEHPMKNREVFGHDHLAITEVWVDDGCLVLSLFPTTMTEPPEPEETTASASESDKLEESEESEELEE